MKNINTLKDFLNESLHKSISDKFDNTYPLIKRHSVQEIKITEAAKNYKDPEIVSATKRGSNNKVKLLIKNGVDINATDIIGRTSLSWAVEKKFIVIVETLINAGADVNMISVQGITALMHASTVKIFNKLLDADADVNIPNKSNRTAISTFLSNNNFDLLYMLLERKKELKLDLDIKDINGNNLYDNLKIELYQSNFLPDYRIKELKKLELYMDEHFPQYREEWDFKNAQFKYNL